MLLCPVRECHLALLTDGRRRVCARGHSFDRAKSGYVNLLQPQERRSKNPGDTAEAVAARRRLHERGVTEPLLRGIDEALRARPGDVVLVNGLLGDHGAAILCARGDMALDTLIESDCACLHGLIETLLAAAPAIRFLRDPTRGGLATVLNEIADASQVAIEIEEAATPIREQVKAFCEILGLDPLYLANEGKIVVIAPPDQACAALAAMRAHPFGEGAAVIGRVSRGEAGRVTMRTVFGGRRIVDMLVGEQLPRIC